MKRNPNINTKTPVTRNAYIVGENGPEVFVPARRGKIIPNPATKLKIAGRREQGGEVDPAVRFDDNTQAGMANVQQALGTSAASTAGAKQPAPTVPPIGDDPSYYTQGRGGSAADAMVRDAASFPPIGKAPAGYQSRYKFAPENYETDPSKIADTTTLTGALAGLGKAAINGIGNLTSPVVADAANIGLKMMDPSGYGYSLTPEQQSAAFTRSVAGDFKSPVTVTSDPGNRPLFAPAPVPPIGDDGSYYNRGRGGSATDAMSRDAAAIAPISADPNYYNQGRGGSATDAMSKDAAAVPPIGDDPSYYNRGRGGSATDAMSRDAASFPPIGGGGTMSVLDDNGNPTATATLDASGAINSDPQWQKMRTQNAINNGGIGGSVNVMTAQQDRATSPGFDNNGDPMPTNQSPADAVKARLGFLPDDYYKDPAKYQHILAGISADLTGQAHLLGAQNQGEYQRGELAIDKPYKEAVAKADLMRSEGTGALNAAHVGALNAQAAYHNAISDPSYLHRQEQIASIRDQGARDRAEQEQTNHVLTSMGADLSNDNVNLLKRYQHDSQTWAGQAANVFSGKTPAIQSWAQAFHRYVYADPKTQEQLAKNDGLTQMMLSFVRQRNPSILQRPMLPTSFRPAKQLLNLAPAAGQEG